MTTISALNRKTFTIFLGLFSLLLLLTIRLLPSIDKIGPYQARKGKTEFNVTSLADHGKGTLREAIVEANKGQQPATIILKASGSIRLENPLPTLLNSGTRLTATGKVSIDAGLLPMNSYALTIKGKEQYVSGIELYGKGGNGLLVLSSRSNLEGCGFKGFERAVAIGGDNITVMGSSFSNNARGVEVLEGALFASIVSNEMKMNTEAGIWGVWTGTPKKEPAFLKAWKNAISGSRYGIVLSMYRAEIKGNFITNNASAIHLLDAADVRIVGNEIHQNSQQGVMMDESVNNYISGNEVYQNGISGILLKRSAGNHITENRIFSNKIYGVAEVLTSLRSSLLPNRIVGNLISDNGEGIYIIASSPVIKGNTFKLNRSSGITITYYEAGGKRHGSFPRIEEQKEMTDPIKRLSDE